MFLIRSLFACLLQPFEIFRRLCEDNDYPTTNPEEGEPLISESGQSDQPTMKQGSLKEQLESRRIECPHRKHSFFIPQNTLEELITPSLVTRDIQTYKGITPAKALEHVKIACQSAQKLYAVLALVKKGSHISDLLDAQITDKDLPLERRDSNFALYRKSKNLEDDPILVFADWTQKEREKFDRFQWWLTAPVFEDKEHYELDDKTILPFIPFQHRDDIKKPIQGGYSEVYPVRLHPAHHKFSILGPENKEPLVAVKKLISADDEEFQKEVTILKILGSKRDPHPNLLKLLCTYRQEGKYHLLFRYANANLRKYWDDRPTIDFDSTNVLWSIRQMTGIANALQVIHNFRVTIPLGIAGAGKGPGWKRVQKDAELSVQHGEDLYGRHGDIKPENILWFQTAEEGSDEGGILQIADFGLGRFHGRESRSKINPDTLARTGTYEPPECKLRRPVSRAYDIWSLGCLYLEYITWMLKGSAEIELFADHRGRLSTNGINDDCFYTIINDPVVGPDAQVREGVLT
ncbi:kinase-like domain-containing protein [Bisporella sp. PMI_857]|nr:kinase-like domain-containing protein [Bisporella sp. PMI_857]